MASAGTGGYLELAHGQNRVYRWCVANPVRFRSALKVEIQNQRITARSQPQPGRRLPALPSGISMAPGPHALLRLRRVGAEPGWRVRLAVG
jgi:hypothetical protein